MASKSSSLIDTASTTQTLSDFKTLNSLSWFSAFYSAYKKEYQFLLGIHPNPTHTEDVYIHLWHNKVKERLNFEYEVSILNDRKEKRYTANYRWNYHPKYNNTINVTTFILHNELTIGANCFITNNQLTLFCEVKILKPGAQILYSSKPTIQQPKICKDIQSMLTTGDYSDFVLAVGGKDFKVHKNILAARSSVFKAMLSADLEEEKQNRVEIIDVDLEVFEQLLRYIYSGTVDKLDEYALELFIAADKYQLDELKSICSQFLGLNLTVDTAAKILVLSDMHSAKELKANCIKFITMNSAKVLATNGWKQMMKTRLELVAELYEDISEVHSALL